MKLLCQQPSAKNCIRETAVYKTRKYIVILYDVYGNEEETRKEFCYARERGIKLIIPSNSLKERNIIRRGKGDLTLIILGVERKRSF